MRDDLKPTDTPAALGWLNEELGEAVSEIGHIYRFGIFATDPQTGIKYNNMSALLEECRHVELAIVKLRESWKRDQINELDFCRQRDLKYTPIDHRSVAIPGKGSPRHECPHVSNVFHDPNMCGYCTQIFGRE